MMTRDELNRLQPGDIIQSASGDGYIVAVNDGQMITATRTLEISNPDEWTLVKKIAKVGRFIQPPRYEEIKAFVLKKAYLNHTMLAKEYNLKYAQAIKVIQALQYDEVITKDYNIQGKGYKVLGGSLAARSSP
jgi:hypothetical protein